MLATTIINNSIMKKVFMVLVLVIDIPATHPNEIAPAFRITTVENSRSEYDKLQEIVRGLIISPNQNILLL